MAERERPRTHVLRRMDSLASAPELQEYLLHGIMEGDQIGVGAFGTVLRLTYQGAVCAGKRLHSLLVTEESNLLEKFVGECRLLKSLRHPHIVQFLGICFLPSSTLPVMVMEYLRHDLHELLESHDKILLSIKLGIMHDISRGLLYLHSQQPPVVHRDLSARNVLLNSSLVAKIADFGVARIINPQQLSRELTRCPGASVYMPPEAGQSDEFAPAYSSKLDIFSLGVVFLFTLTQDFPQNLLQATFHDENDVFHPRTELERRQHYVDTGAELLDNPRHPLLVLIRECLSNIPRQRPNTASILNRVGEMSREVRDNYTDMSKLEMVVELQRLYDEQQGVLYHEDDLGVLLREREQEIVRLSEEVGEKRRQLAHAQNQLQSSQSSLFMKDREIDLLRRQLQTHQQRVEEREQELNSLHVALQQHESEQDNLGSALRQLEELRQEQWEWQQRELDYLHQIRQLSGRQTDSEARCAETVRLKNIELSGKREEVTQAKRAVEEKLFLLEEQRGIVQCLQGELLQTRNLLREKEEQAADTAQLRDVSQRLEAVQHEVARLSLENASLRNMAMTKPPPQPLGLHVNLPLTSVLTQATLFGVNSARAVMLGSNVIVGGGKADIENVQNVLFFRQDKGWGFMPKYSLSLFAMAVLEGRLLLLVGGYNHPMDTYSSDVVQYDRHDKAWRPIFTPMPTPRSDAAALCYKQYLLVAGGSNGTGYLQRVEVLDTRSAVWTSVAPLPVPIEGLIQSASHIDPAHPQSDSWYLMGWEKGLRSPPNTFCLSLDHLLREVKGGAAQPVAWVQLPDPPLASCGAVTFRGFLLAVGGKDRQSRKRKDIYLYLPGTCEWLRVSELPTPRHSCTCISLSSEEFLVIGGCDETDFSTRVDIVHT